MSAYSKYSQTLSCIWRPILGKRKVRKKAGKGSGGECAPAMLAVLTHCYKTMSLDLMVSVVPTAPRTSVRARQISAQIGLTHISYTWLPLQLQHEIETVR